MAKSIKGWFATKDRPGDRTLEQQMTGLDDLLDFVPGKTVLDVGCAEGLIDFELFDAGAMAIHGIEIRPEHVAVGNKLRGHRAVTLEVADANVYKPVRQYDIVLMLAVLQKLRDPSAAAARFAAAARRVVILRLPPAHAPRIVDSRSGNVVHDVGQAVISQGFMLKNAQLGHLGEWIGIYEKRSD